MTKTQVLLSSAVVVSTIGGPAPKSLQETADRRLPAGKAVLSHQRLINCRAGDPGLLPGARPFPAVDHLRFRLEPPLRMPMARMFIIYPGTLPNGVIIVTRKLDFAE